MKENYPKTVAELIELCAETMYASVDENFSTNEYEVEVETKDGYVYIGISPDDPPVCIAHKNGSERECPLLCEEIGKKIPSWRDLEDAYIRWYVDCDGEPGLDPAFQSWEQVNGMFIAL